MYEVIRDFTDLQDNEYPYNVGDIFPHDGLEVGEERLKELSSSQNLQKRPLIKKIGGNKPYTKSDIQRMKKSELLEIARNTGVEGADDMTREELAEYLLNVFGL